MKGIIRCSLAGAAALALALSIASCGRKDGARPPLPPSYSAETLERANALINGGFALFEAGAIDSAIAKLEEAARLAPGAFLPQYALVCAKARAGKTEDAVRALERLVEDGADYVWLIEKDTDLESIRGDSRYPQILERARRNDERGSAFLAGGFPEYDASADTFATEASLASWKDAEDARRREHGMLWTNAQSRAHQFDVVSRYLANVKRIRSSDPSFDAGLERVRAASRMSSIYMPGWGAVADLVRRETDLYAKIVPPGAGLAEANYLAALALSLKFGDGDERRIPAFREAEEYLARVGEANEYSAAARALGLANKAKSPGADDAALGAELEALLAEFPADDRLSRIVTTRLGPDAVRLLWPVPIDAEDIDGKTVSIDQYAGKILLIDFWATWCAPCRMELPGIAAAYEKYHGRGLEILSISLDYAERVPVEALRDSTAAHGMAWRHIYDGLGWNTALAKRWFVGSIPAPFLVNRDGSLAAWGDDLRGTKLAVAIEKAL